MCVACTPGAATAQQATDASSINGASSISEPSPDLTAIRNTISALNATAGGPVARQRAELENYVTSAEKKAQRDCPAATKTLAFDPAYSSLRKTPDDWQDAAPTTPNTTGYLLPAYISIYTDSRITGSDLTTLQLWVSDGIAHTAALCVA